jgi:hypothetical protein
MADNWTDILQLCAPTFHGCMARRTRGTRPLATGPLPQDLISGDLDGHIVVIWTAHQRRVRSGEGVTR